jgi:predicted GTPase
VVKIDETDFVLADLPGLIEGAHEGVGLGDRFLGHAERCASILHLIDGTGDAVAKAYKTIRAELEAYGHGLDEKPEIVALNKVDAIAQAELAKKRSSLEKACGHKVHIISGVTGEGINTVLRAMAREVNRRRAERAEAARYGRPTPVPRTRAERQAVNFNAPVVPASRSKPETAPVKASTKASEKIAKTKAPAKGPAKSPRKMDTPKAKAKKAAKKAGSKATKKAATTGGKAKAKPKTGSRTAKRTKKKQRR